MIGRMSHDAQIMALREAVNLWAPGAYEDGFAPLVTVRLYVDGEPVQARVLDAAEPHDGNGPPLLVMQREGERYPVYVSANLIRSISFGGRSVK